jgi:hypothetical protein
VQQQELGIVADRQSDNPKELDVTCRTAFFHATQWMGEAEFAEAKRAGPSSSAHKYRHYKNQFNLLPDSRS